MATAMKAKKVVQPAENETTVVENETVVSAAVEQKPIVTKHVEKQKKEYKEHEGIPCKSITAGKMFMEGRKSKIVYRWEDAGDVVEIEYQDLIAAIRSGNGYVMRPLFVIEDKELVSQYPQLSKVYDVLYSVDDLKDVLVKLNVGDMIATIKALPVGAQDSIKHLASRMVSNGTLDSVSKIKALDEFYNTELMLMTGLFGDTE